MHVAILYRSLTTPGGAETSMRNLAAAVGHDNVVCTNSGRDVTKRFPVPLPTEFERTSRFLGYLRSVLSKLSKFGPDLILSQHEPSLAGAVAAGRLDVPHVLFVHDYTLVYDDERWAGSVLPSRIANFLLSYPNQALSQRVFDSADLVIANSHYLREEYADKLDAPLAVVHPFVDPDDFEVAPGGEYITHINPKLHKGIDVTLEVAAQLPDEQFLIVGPDPHSDSVRDRIDRASNVEFGGYTEDMNSVYRQSKLVLVPSRLESFGLIPLEAGYSGVPALTSAEGGLAESTYREKFRVDSNDPAEYVDRIRAVLDDYETFQSLAADVPEKYSLRSQVARLDDALDAEFGVRLCPGDLEASVPRG